MSGTVSEWDDAQETVLIEPWQYICQLPGKQIRGKLMQVGLPDSTLEDSDQKEELPLSIARDLKAFNFWLNISEDKLQIISKVIQMLHNASLLIDDIEDNSKLRRGIPVAHSIYGIPQTINSANYIYFLGLAKALTLDHPQVTQVFTEQMLELHRGQGMDIWWRDNLVCPTEEEYKMMVKRKTGGLFGLGIRLMQLFSSNQSNMGPLTEALGLYFQIRDDYANLLSTEYTTNKSFCEDLTEGKFSFPIIHGIRSQQDRQILNILRQRTTDVEMKKYCIDLLERAGSFEYTKKFLITLEEESLNHIAALGGNAFLESLLKELSTLYKEESPNIPSSE